MFQLRGKFRVASICLIFKLLVKCNIFQKRKRRKIECTRKTCETIHITNQANYKPVHVLCEKDFINIWAEEFFHDATGGQNSSEKL